MVQTYNVKPEVVVVIVLVIIIIVMVAYSCEICGMKFFPVSEFWLMNFKAKGDTVC